MSVTTVPASRAADVRPPGRTEVSVPWLHLLPLAVVLAFANGFWLVVLRGAVGSIERTTAPFDSWLRESTALVPWYVLALLVAFALALRWHGARPRGLAGTAGFVCLVVAAGTVAGTIVLFASSVIDYRLQAPHLEHMATVHTGCDSACLSQRLQDTWHLELKAGLIGVVLMAVTDLVLVLLVLALRGGTIRTGRVRAVPAARVADGRVVLAACLLGAAAIHAAVVPEHLDEWWAAGTFFVVLTLAEWAAAAAVLSRRPGLLRPSLHASVVVSVVPLVVWAVSRAAGLPFGPEAGEPEPIGGADVLACILELTALILAVRLLRARQRDRVRSRYSHAVALAAVLTATTLGVGCTSLPVVNLFPGIGSGHHAEVGEALGSLR